MKKRKMDLNSKNTDYSKYFVWAVVILLLFLSYKIVQPYLIAVISAFILAYLVKPLFERLNNKMNKRLSAIICILVILAIILIPLATITAGLISQARYLINNNPLEEISQSPLLEKLGIDVAQASTDFMRSIISLMNSSVYYLPATIITLIIIIFGMYYILIDWELLIHKLKGFIHSPLGAIPRSLLRKL